MQNLIQQVGRFLFHEEELKSTSSTGSGVVAAAFPHADPDQTPAPSLLH
jgi:hypothetical protein